MSAFVWKEIDTGVSSHAFAPKSEPMGAGKGLAWLAADFSNGEDPQPGWQSGL